jgi:hypothetical protein
LFSVVALNKEYHGGLLCFLLPPKRCHRDGCLLGQRLETQEQAYGSDASKWHSNSFARLVCGESCQIDQSTTLLAGYKRYRASLVICEVTAQGKEIRFKGGIWVYIQRVWKSIPQSLLKNLVDSITDRLNEVIKARGDPTKY